VVLALERRADLGPRLFGHWVRVVNEMADAARVAAIRVVNEVAGVAHQM
jgi:hypothetical protein